MTVRGATPAWTALGLWGVALLVAPRRAELASAAVSVGSALVTVVAGREPPRR